MRGLALAGFVADRLYILKPDFKDAGAKQFCGECAMVEGMLSFYPQLRKAVDVRYVGFTRPRPEIVSELGPDNQSSPVLVLGSGNIPKTLPTSVVVQEHEGKRFINDPYGICDYLAVAHGTGSLHR